MALRFAVDIPDAKYVYGAWDCLGYFETRAEAIAWVKEHFGGDDEGRIQVVSELPEDEQVDD